LAVTSVRGSQKGTTAVAILAPLLILGLPLLDTGLAVTRRLYRLGRRGVRNGGAPSYILRNINEVFLPDRGHIHHRLMDMGLSHRGAVLLLYSVGALFALAAFALVLFRTFWLAALLVGVLALMTVTFVSLLYFGVGRSERREPTEEIPAPVKPSRPATARPLASSSGQPGR
jgi:UDP-GlcNAc:undecaprenyl-phosphate GlcNAc-1-phosphate transferase